MQSLPIYPLAQQLEFLGGSILGILPELILAGTFVLAVVLEISLGKRNKQFVPIVSLAGMILSAVAVVGLWDSQAQVVANGLQDDPFLGMIRPDGFAAWFKLLVAFIGILTLLVSMQAGKVRAQARGMGEYYLLLLAMLIGMYFMSMSLNLLMMYLALELVSIPSYILTAYTRMQAKSAEASLKYIIYGAFSSGIMLYGISWLYGFTGTLDMRDPAFEQGLMAAGDWPVTFVLILVLGGFAFKISALPFHFWTPDVYEGAPYPVAAFFAVAPKAAGFAMLLRFLALLPNLEGKAPFLFENLSLILGLMAIGSMLIGNLAALGQKNLRRMLAYSGIAQAGYVLIAAMWPEAIGQSAVMFYLTIYVCMTFGAFLVAGWMAEKLGTEDIDDLRGLAGKIPLLAVLLTIFMVSLTGLPPTAGFVGKWSLVMAGLEAYKESGQVIIPVAIIAMLINTVISLFYYLRPPSRMIFGNLSIKSTPQFHGLIPVLLVILAIPTLLLGFIYFDELINFLQHLSPN